MLMQWLSNNAEWIFSGIGATLVAVIFGGFKVLLDKRAAAKRIEAARSRSGSDRVRGRSASLPVIDPTSISRLTIRHDEYGGSRICHFCRRAETVGRKLLVSSGANICEECLDGGLAELDKRPGDSDNVAQICRLTYTLATEKIPEAQRHQYEADIHRLSLAVRKRRRERPGDIVADAQLIRPLGAGNFATVWEARPRTSRKLRTENVAVKIFDQDKLGFGLMLWRFQRGIRAMRKLTDLGKSTPSSIVRLYDISPDLLSFSMEFLPGGDLQSLPKQGLKLEKRIAIFCQVAEGVAFAHDHGIIHRDIKPANVVINSHGGAVLTDFDIADLTFATTQSVYAGGLGTPQFAAPEQLLGSNKIAHPSSDIFSLGKLLYFVYTEQAPPIGSTEPEHTPSYLRSIPHESVRNAIELAIREQPDQRPQSVTELLAILGSGATDFSESRLFKGL